MGTIEILFDRLAKMSWVAIILLSPCAFLPRSEDGSPLPMTNVLLRTWGS